MLERMRLGIMSNEQCHWLRHIRYAICPGLIMCDAWLLCVGFIEGGDKELWRTCTVYSTERLKHMLMKIYSSHIQSRLCQMTLVTSVVTEDFVKGKLSSVSRHRFLLWGTICKIQYENAFCPVTLCWNRHTVEDSLKPLKDRFTFFLVCLKSLVRSNYVCLLQLFLLFILDCFQCAKIYSYMCIWC